MNAHKPFYECAQTILEPHSGFCVFLMGLDLLNVLHWLLKPQPLGLGAVHLRLKLEGVDFHPSTATCQLCDEGRIAKQHRSLAFAVQEF